MNERRGMMMVEEGGGKGEWGSEEVDGRCSGKAEKEGRGNQRRAMMPEKGKKEGK
ncbi:hypothetical protein [Cytobacillus praedii]|uniref:hypothetical protein n=1 Tax=Cytobacillus praedii TaxID=1742358 RepID=UPI003AF5E88F